MVLKTARANGEPVDDDTINGIRAGLMGPLAGIGDSLIVGTLIPILLGIAMGLSQGGNPLGAIFYIVVWNLLAFFGMRFAYYRGYKLGGDAVQALVGPNATALRQAIVMVGTIVIGAVDATWVSVTTALQLPNGPLQDTLTSIYPGLLSLLFTVFCWWLMARKKVSRYRCDAYPLGYRFRWLCLRILRRCHNCYGELITTIVYVCPSWSTCSSGLIVKEFLSHEAT